MRGQRAKANNAVHRLFIYTTYTFFEPLGRLQFAPLCLANSLVFLISSRPVERSSRTTGLWMQL